MARYWPRRYTVVGLCFFATLICYVDRVNISVAIIPMAEEFGWDRTTQGVVLSSFFYGYLATQILGGWLSDRYGGKVVLSVGVLLWSFFTIVTPPAAVASFVVLFLVRVGMGLAEGVSFPAFYSLFARWIPSGERTRAIGLITSGVPLGTVGALFLTPYIVVYWGWPMAFYLFGALGVIWYAIWQLRVTALPEDHPTIRPEELELIGRLATTPDAAARPANPPWRKLLSSAPVWALIICHFCSNWGFYVLLTWLPVFVNQELGIDLAQVGLYSLLPHLVAFAMINVACTIADGLIRRGLSVTTTRKLMQTIGSVGAAAFLLAVSSVSSAVGAIACICAVFALGSFQVGGSGVNHLDIGPRYAGVLLGISNMAGTLPGVVGVTLTGFILDATGSWALVFGIAAGFYLLGLVFWLTWSTGEQIFD